MPVISAHSLSGYAARMPGSTGTTRRPRAHREAPPRKQRPNRIYELTKARGWTAAIVAEKVRALAEARGLDHRLGTHEVTINRLSTSPSISQEWMELLGEIYQVPASEIIAPPPAAGLRRVRVKGALQAGEWAEQHEWPDDEQYDVMVPDDPALRGVPLYAGEIRGNSMNLRYPSGAIIIMSPLRQHPGEITEGRRYHVRLTHADGNTEETIKTLVRRDDRYWLKPESDDPEFQQWIALDGIPGATVELIGRVRGVYHRED